MKKIKNIKLLEYIKAINEDLSDDIYVLYYANLPPAEILVDLFAVVSKMGKNMNRLIALIESEASTST